MTEPTTMPTEPTMPSKSVHDRINDILAEGHMPMPVLLAPVSGTPVPAADFLAEYINRGWRLEVRIVERPKQ